ncbi:helix-turn-helix transcriptional regulator [Mesorhizobium sp. 113-3-3]|uniref:helix-turn-helix transcriptional regulator n=1 Tax=Mesorhizobium sp. 113-3-3 TaxID=2744516 RepID=UPI00192594E7|nr:LuxR C-terminal-related transcriptional regulator [Mesorhizobium sp. 113-3-3]BCG76721.1 helix-turn-helix transcriptional regulator [Mesorhizobium sp. 113-3-3]
MRMGNIWAPLAKAIAATGTDRHVDCLIDLIGADIEHDLVTVTRYSTTQTPEFVKHRRFSDEMVKRYLDNYYVFDPFYASWRRERRLGIMPLKRLADDEAKRGQYIAGFLTQSEICDEVGIMLADGGDWCLGIFLDRSTASFKDSEIALLDERLPVFEALHALDIKARGSDFARTSAPTSPGASPQQKPTIPMSLWPELSLRERELVQLILAGHPTANIAERLGITVGTVKNHRRRIYEKLDITTERELFLQFFQHRGDR